MGVWMMVVSFSFLLLALSSAAVFFALWTQAPRNRGWILALSSIGVILAMGLGRALPFLVSSSVLAFFAASLLKLTRGALRNIVGAAYLVVAFGIFAFYKNPDWYQPGVIEEGWAGFLKIWLPLGLGYVTLQNASYVLDTWMGVHSKGSESLGSFMGVSLFFGNLAVGPIHRPMEQMERLETAGRLSPDRFKRSAMRIGVGFFKKGLADLLAIYVSAFPVEEPFYSIPYLVWALCLVARFYADFSALCDVAIGCGWMFGLEIPENFDQPYLARNMADFWRRWHMSLGHWFRRYVFNPISLFAVRHLPMGAPRWLEKLVIGFSVLLVFTLIGAWHGAGQIYVVWGLFNGAAVLLSDVWKWPLPKSIARAMTLVAVAVGQIIIVTADHESALRDGAKVSAQGAPLVYLMWTSAGVAGLLGPHALDSYMKKSNWLASHPRLYWVAIAFICLFSGLSIRSGSAFVYGNF